MNRISSFLCVFTYIFSLALIAGSVEARRSKMLATRTSEDISRLSSSNLAVNQESSNKFINAPSNISSNANEKTSRILYNTQDLNFTRGREKIEVALGRLLFFDNKGFIPKAKGRILQNKLLKIKQHDKLRKNIKSPRILASLNTIDLNNVRETKEQITVDLGRALYFDTSNSVRDTKFFRPASHKRILKSQSRLSIVGDLEEKIDSAYGRSQKN